jgi:hypothetical protein
MIVPVSFELHVDPEFRKCRFLIHESTGLGAVDMTARNAAARNAGD